MFAINDDLKSLTAEPLQKQFKFNERWPLKQTFDLNLSFESFQRDSHKALDQALVMFLEENFSQGHWWELTRVGDLRAAH